MIEFIKQNSDVLIFAGSVILGALILTPFLHFLIDRFLRRNNEHLKVDPTSFKFLKNSLSVIIIIVAAILIIYRIPGGKGLAVSMFAGAGIFAAVAGFASQSAFSNIVSGIFIVIFKPFRVGDLISVGADKSGTVEDITLRHTVIRDFENKRIIMPNSVISGETVLNQSLVDEKICRHVEFSISYDSDIDLARKILQEEAMAHPLCIDNRNEEAIANGDPVVQVLVVRFADSAVVLRAWVWSANAPDSFKVFTSMNESVKKRFDAEGIEIPFPYRTIVYKKDIA